MRLTQMVGSAARNVFKASAAMTDDVLRVAALLVPCLLGLWTAVACRRAHYHGLPGADALVWAGLSAVFFLLSLMKTARGLGLLRGFGDFLRGIFKQRGWYEDRRSLQITASIAVAVVVTVLVVWGLLWAWHRIKRYRLAHRLCGPDRELWDYSLHFSARGRRMERERALGTHGHRPRGRCWGIGAGHRPVPPAERAPALNPERGGSPFTTGRLCPH
jgi:hypothetical protein